MSIAAQRLDAAIIAECAACRPCPDLLAYYEGLRNADDGAINQALNELDGDEDE